MGSTQRRTFSPQFKLETVVEVLRGQKTTAQICRERDITENLLYRWKQTFWGLRQNCSCWRIPNRWARVSRSGIVACSLAVSPATMQ